MLLFALTNKNRANKKKMGGMILFALTNESKAYKKFNNMGGLLLFALMNESKAYKKKMHLYLPQTEPHQACLTALVTKACKP
jgi:hypothetical protein